MAMDCSFRHAGWPLSSPQASPCPPRYLQKMLTPYITNSATASHHSSSPHNISTVLPFPSPTHEHPIKCAAFCAVHPSHTHHCSSHLPISQSHCRCGPLSVTIYTNPFTALGDHFICAGALGYTGNPCLIPAGVAIMVFCVRRPISTSLRAVVSAASLPPTPLCPLTHINTLGRSLILSFATSPSSIHGRGHAYFRLFIRWITP